MNVRTIKTGKTSNYDNIRQ